MNRREIYDRMKRSPANVRFDDICRNAVEFGFLSRGGRGSHRIYVKPGVREMLNFQNVNGMAKPYQVRQFTKLIEKYDLLGDQHVT
jgi:hypothetical protein